MFPRYAQICAGLGRGHHLDRALAAFAEHYVDQNERDYATLKSSRRYRPDRRSVPLSMSGHPADASSPNGPFSPFGYLILIRVDAAIFAAEAGQAAA
jgi:hypothetical protein